MKRLIDIISSLVAVVVFAIPITIIAILLIYKEKHSVFFKQERIGRQNIFGKTRIRKMVFQKTNLK